MRRTATALFALFFSLQASAVGLSDLSNTEASKGLKEALIQGAGKAEPDAITEALWKVDFMGLNGPIKFQKQGPSGKESGQSMPNLYLIKIEDGKVVLAES